MKFNKVAMDMWEVLVNSSHFFFFNEIADINNSNNNGNKITNPSKKKKNIYIYIYNYCILLELLIRWRLREKMEKRLTWLGLTVYLHSKRS